MTSLFFDTNIILDFLGNREPFALEAQIILNMAIEKKIEVYVSSQSYNDSYYLLRKRLSHSQSMKLLQNIYA